MKQLLKNHLKNQQSNYIILIVALLFSTYFSTLNTCHTNEILIEKKYNFLKSELIHQRLYMRKCLNSNKLSRSDKNKIQEILLATNHPNLSHSKLINTTSNWATLFNKYLSSPNADSKSNFDSMNSSFEKLRSLGTRYNLDLDKHTSFTQNFLPKLLCSKQTNLLSYLPLSNQLFDKNKFLIVL